MTNYEQAELDEERAKAIVDWDAQQAARQALTSLPMTWHVPGSIAADPSGLNGMVRYLAQQPGDDDGRRRGVLTIRGGDVALIAEDGSIVGPDGAIGLGPYWEHPLYAAARRAGYKFDT